jgi:hypothetical protein
MTPDHGNRQMNDTATVPEGRSGRKNAPQRLKSRR